MNKRISLVIVSSIMLVIGSNVTLALVLLSGCSTWNNDFEGEVVRARPHDSIHQISKLVDRGVIKETDDDFVLSESMIAHTKVFRNGKVSRGVEDVRRVYLMTYEDTGKNLHLAHHTYFVLKPATWVSR